MRILYIHPVEVPSIDANTIQVMRMCEAFAQNGHEVELLALRGSLQDCHNLYEFYGVSDAFAVTRTAHYAGWGRTFAFSILATIAASWERSRLVYTRDARVADFCTRLRIPTIYESHTLRDLSPRSKAALKRTMNRPEFLRIVLISQALQNKFLDNYPSLLEKTMVAHDGAKTGSAGTLPTAGNNDAFRAVYAGHLYPGKGIDLLIAAGRLAQDVTIEIVGGAQSDIDRWRALAADVGSVRFGGFLPPAAIANCLRRADAVLAPYQVKVMGADRKTEIGAYMSPLKVFEYMAVGRAIIASDVPVLREVLTHGETALLCPPDEPVAWSEALRRLKDDPELRVRLGRNARALLEREFTWKRRAERVLEGLQLGRRAIRT